MEILKLRNIITDIQNSKHGFHSRLDTTKKSKINELEDSTVEKNSD